MGKCAAAGRGSRGYGGSGWRRGTRRLHWTCGVTEAQSAQDEVSPTKVGGQRPEALLKNEPDLAFRWRVRTVLAYLDPQPDDQILDCGCGLGFYLMALSRLASCQLCGLDHDLQCLKFAQRLVRGAQVGPCLGDLYHMPYADERFDKVLLSEVLEHLDDDQAGLREVWRVLRPGGILVVTVPNCDYPFLYDPINWVSERLLRRRIRSGSLAGAWMDHRRLYRQTDVAELLRRADFVIIESRMLTSCCFPFTHNVVYGIGKGLLQGSKLPHLLLDEVDRFHPEAGRRQPWNPMTWFIRAINWIDLFNLESSGKTRFVNIGVKAMKPQGLGRG
jgi:ubiquinone/menaquinone biosynthesis C-methylase UbiE